MKPIIIDVCQPEEFSQGHVAGALSMPPDQVVNVGISPTALDSVPRDAIIIAYCATGSRAAAAKAYLTQAGYTNVINGINQVQVEALLAKGDF